MAEVVSITVPMAPVSVNAYVRHTRAGRHYKTQAALSFEQMVKLYSRNKSVAGDTFAVGIKIFPAPGQKIDCDNACKVLIDSLARAGVFMDRKGKPKTDYHITKLTVERFDDLREGKTEVTIEAR